MILQFEPFETVVSQSFWKALTKRKLETGLDESEFDLFGYYELGHLLPDDEPAPPKFYLDETSFETFDSLSKDKVQMAGEMKLFNRIDDFKSFDKAAWLKKLKDDIPDFFVVAFADLKKYRYYYNVCYPVPVSVSDPVTVELSSRKNNEEARVLLDSSCRDGVVGWPIRRLLFDMQTKQICVKRRNSKHDLNIEFISGPGKCTVDLQWTGWEKNTAGKIGPKMVDLSSSMDPIKLAEEAAALNLKLIKWRLLPELDLDRIAKTRCLLIGAGTLGCNVTRCLLAWGVRDITLVDSGRVSFSNPVRQSLFTHEDCLDGGRPKAEAAAQRALEICPFARVKGHSISIPMPGHNITEEDEFVSACTELDQLVRDHDVVFLLTDSRESRWLPALLGAVHDKIVLTVALGFDSFVAMRHGAPGEPIGCYFCHDVNTPTDTLSGRTLDQQCTVTRPGLSYMASATAVELLASILQHPQGNRAPASVATSPTEPLPKGSSILGMVPHQVRGFVSHFQNLILSGEQFECCSACSSTVIDQYKEHGIEFVRKAVSKPGHLDEVTGLAALRDSEQARIDAFLDDMAASDNDF